MLIRRIGRANQYEISKPYWQCQGVAIFLSTTVNRQSQFFCITAKKSQPAVFEQVDNSLAKAEKCNIFTLSLSSVGFFWGGGKLF